MPKGTYGRPSTKPERQMRKRRRRQAKEDKSFASRIKNITGSTPDMKGTVRTGNANLSMGRNLGAAYTPNARAANARKYKDSIERKALKKTRK